MNQVQADRLRAPFPPEQIGHLPKGGVQLDYVGHAATTDRLLQVDPEWNWKPYALDERGLPALDADGNLWIVLTVAGVSRPGVGDGRNMKERIGDAIRNAAMRFGVALDLWAKEDLQAEPGSGKPETAKKAAPSSRKSKEATAEGGAANQDLMDQLAETLMILGATDSIQAIHEHKDDRPWLDRQLKRAREAVELNETTAEQFPIPSKAKAAA